MPHAWLADGSAMQDRIREEGFTLLRVGRTKADTSALGAALQDLGASFATMDITDAAPRDIYGFDLIQLSSDMHIVWRGNAPPSDSATLAATVTGH